MENIISKWIEGGTIYFIIAVITASLVFVLRWDSLTYGYLLAFLFVVLIIFYAILFLSVAS